MALRQGKEHRAYIEIKKEIHIHTQKLKLYFILIIPNSLKIPNNGNFFNNQIMFFFYLEAIFSSTVHSERDESHARLVLLCFHISLLIPVQ